MAIQRSEYLDRIFRLAQLARASGLDGVMLSGESNVDYFSGYRHHAPWTVFARPFFVIITADGRTAMVAHGFLRAEMERTSIITDVRGYTRSGTAPTALLAETLRDLGLEGGRIGGELGYEQRIGMGLQDVRDLEEMLPNMNLVDAAGLLWGMRCIKSSAEIDLLVQSAAITGQAFEACFAAARLGMTEREVAVIAGRTMLERGADRPGFVLTAAGRENYRCLSGKPSDRPLRRGDMLWIDMGAVYQGYWSDFCRAAIIGSPSHAQCELQKVILDVNRACIDAVKPGEPIKRVAEAAEQALKRTGYESPLGENRIGHGIGLMSTEPPHVALYEDTLMEEGLVFTIEPRILSDEGVFNCEELLLVTAMGAKVLTNTPRELTVIN